MTARAEDGFTLLEMLVAMAVLSLGALALLNLAGENTRTAGVIEERFFASVVAENRAIEALTSTLPPALGEASGADPAGGRTWSWTMRASAAAAGMTRLDVQVRPPQGRGVAGEVVAFRGPA